MFSNGRIRSPGPLWGSVEHWGDGIITRGVLLDVPRYRGEPFVAVDRPVHGWELDEVARAQGVTVLAGDALVVFCGREEYSKAHSQYDPIAPRTGLHASCLEYLRDVDCSILAWDMGEYGDSGAPMNWSDYLIHYLAISEFGLALVDNALIAPVAQACAEENRYEFLFVMAPLRIADGTGSPVNPLAIF
jgi:kynurenine formamidase